MSLDEEKSINGRVFLGFFDTKRTLNTLREKTIQLGKQFEQMGKKLQSELSLTRTDLENCDYFLSKATREDIVETAADIKKAELELTRLGDRLRGLGYGDAVKDEPCRVPKG
jgi:hypothetical protein